MVKKVKSQAQGKGAKGEVTNLLASVPKGYDFLCHDGKKLSSMKELAEGLMAMSDETFAYHVNPERNDFSNWVRDVIKDGKLASELIAATTRLEAAGIVAARLAFLRKGLY